MALREPAWLRDLESCLEALPITTSITMRKPSPHRLGFLLSGEFLVLASKGVVLFAQVPVKCEQGFDAL